MFILLFLWLSERRSIVILQNWVRLKEQLDTSWVPRVKKLVWNSTFKKLRSWHPVPSLHGKWWGKNGNSNRFYFLGFQNHCRWWPQPLMVSHEIKRRLLLGRKAMTNLDSALKSRDITLLTKVHLVKAMVFPVVMYGCESWTIKKVEHWKIEAFKLWC